MYTHCSNPFSVPPFIPYSSQVIRDAWWRQTDWGLNTDSAITYFVHWHMCAYARHYLRAAPILEEIWLLAESNLLNWKQYWILNPCSPGELDCGNHLCEIPCHQGACPSCPMLQIHVTMCPCGPTPLSELLPNRYLIPVPADEPHYCTSQCHLGDYPPCEKTWNLWCQCGRTSVRVECLKVQGRGEYQCQHVKGLWGMKGGGEWVNKQSKDKCRSRQERGRGEEEGRRGGKRERREYSKEVI